MAPTFTNLCASGLAVQKGNHQNGNAAETPQRKYYKKAVFNHSFYAAVNTC